LCGWVCSCLCVCACVCVARARERERERVRAKVCVCVWRGRDREYVHVHMCVCLSVSITLSLCMRPEAGDTQADGRTRWCTRSCTQIPCEHDAYEDATYKHTRSACIQTRSVEALRPTTGHKTHMPALCTNTDVHMYTFTHIPCTHVHIYTYTHMHIPA
jgi:hypothetical protein